MKSNQLIVSYKASEGVHPLHLTEALHLTETQELMCYKCV